MPKQYKAKLTLLLLLLPWAGISTSADTTSGKESAVTAQKVTAIEEILVTAQRREQSLGEISLAITAIDGDDIVDLHMGDPSDLAQQVPTLQIKTIFSKSNPQIFLRGVGVNDDTALTSGAVGIYSDDVYIGAPAGQLFPLFDLQRIEVLRGPQGTLYGRNTTAGAINFISRQPGERLETSIRLGFGNFGQRTIEAAVGGPLSSDLGARAAFVSNKRDGYMDNMWLDADNANVDNWAAKGIVSYEFTDDLSAKLKVHGAKNNAQVKQFKSQGLFDPVALAAGAFAPCASPAKLGTCSDRLGYVDTSDPHSGQWDRVGREDVDIKGGSVNLTGMLGVIELTSITAYDSTERFLQPDTDASPHQVVHIDWRDSNEQFSQEFRLFSPPDASVSWIAGAYYLNQKINIRQTNDVFRELRPIFGFDPDRLIFTLNTQIDQDLESYAAFGQADFALRERFNMVLGLRYTDERRDMSRHDALVEPDFSIPLVQLSDSVSFDNWSGRLALEYLDEDDKLLYASLSSGFKSGGFNGAVALDPSSVPPFDEETLVTIELGYKWTGFSDRLSINAAGFYTDYEDLQVFTRVTDDGIPRELLTNAADARVLGLEIEMSALFDPDIELRLGLGLLDTELKDFQTTGGQDFSGNRLVGAPDTTFNGLVRKQFRLSHGVFKVQANFHYQDGVFFETSNDSLLAQEAYWLFGARLGYQSLSRPWELAIWADNLSDETYMTGAVGLGVFGYNLQSYGEPRTWGVEFIWRQ